MNLDDLTLDDLLDAPPQGGVITFARMRTLLLGAEALGLLRAELVERLGLLATRGVFTRFGYAHGWFTADVLRDELDWDDVSAWRRAGGRLHKLQGLVDFEPVDATDPEQPCFAAAIWRESYEAEQHLRHLGRADEPVCWSLVGFASGYLSRAFGEPILAMESACRGRGDEVCRMIARRVDDWGERATEAIDLLERDCLESDLLAVQRALLHAEAELEARRQLLHLDPAPRPDIVDGVVARSAAMRRVVDQARRVARVDATVLVTGESGTGKERVARLIHDHSPRARGPFLAINCGALNETLLESELFGHARGAFTGAVTDRIGLLEAASGGTLLLDEIGEVPVAVQIKLLRVLETRSVRRLGENLERPIDVRIVAATWRDLRHAVADGRIRQDFYFRLRVVEIEIAPLRERPDDILPLVRLLLAQQTTGPRKLDRDALRAVMRYPWPGNVRELANALEHGVAMATGDAITVDDLPADVRDPTPTPAITSGPTPSIATLAGSQRLADVERALIEEVLADTDGNRAEAARRLGIGQATLYRRLASYRES